MKPKIYIGVPYWETIDPEFMMQVMAMVFALQRNPGFSVAFGMEGNRPVHDNRNILVENAREMGASHIWMIDADTFVPHDSLPRLLAHDKAIVGASYPFRFPGHGKPIGNPVNKQPQGDLLEMYNIPAGCLLIRMDVFDQMAKPYFAFPPHPDKAGPNSGKVISEDIWFFGMAQKAKIKIWCDLKLTSQIDHMGKALYRANPEYIKNMDFC
jgi:hypothetical protein